MGRVSKDLTEMKSVNDAAVEAEFEEISSRPDDIPKEVWSLIQETGKLATERLHDIIASPKFMRLKAADQAKLIALAQNRAYGTPKSGTAEAVARTKRRAGARDMTAEALRNLATRAALPEYSQEIVDVEFETDEDLTRH